MPQYMQYLEYFNALQKGLPKSAKLDPDWAATERLRLQQANVRLTPSRLGAIVARDKVLALFIIGAFCKEASGMTVNPHVASTLTFGYEWGCYQANAIREFLASRAGKIFAPYAGQPVCSISHVAAAFMLAEKLAELAKTAESKKLDSAKVAAIFDCYATLASTFPVFDDAMRRGEQQINPVGRLQENRDYNRGVLRLFRRHKPLQAEVITPLVEAEMQAFVGKLLFQSRGRLLLPRAA